MQDSGRALWDAGTNIFNKTHLSVSTHPELQGAKDSHHCTDIRVVVSGTASPVATRQGDFWHPMVWSSSVLEKAYTFLESFPPSNLRLSGAHTAWGGGWTPLPGPSGGCWHLVNDQHALPNGLSMPLAEPEVVRP